ncbi:hypothetical protein S40293_01682 [Stachybotrys chartarum IBT 40293]|nr:hypothetical protein S40293_01682 [Stachybotrys chartarum IBT 40293]
MAGKRRAETQDEASPIDPANAPSVKRQRGTQSKRNGKQAANAGSRTVASTRDEQPPVAKSTKARKGSAPKTKQEHPRPAEPQPPSSSSVPKQTTQPRTSKRKPAPKTKEEKLGGEKRKATVYGLVPDAPESFSTAHPKSSKRKSATKSKQETHRSPKPQATVPHQGAQALGKEPAVQPPTPKRKSRTKIKQKNPRLSNPEDTAPRRAASTVDPVSASKPPQRGKKRVDIEAETEGPSKRVRIEEGPDSSRLEAGKEKEPEMQGDEEDSDHGTASSASVQDDAEHANVENHPMFGKHDHHLLRLKPDRKNRPCWIDAPSGTVIMEKFSPLAAQATDFLVTIAEPSSRPSSMHEYVITTNSLYAAASLGLGPDIIIQTLDRFLKTELPESVKKFVKSCSSSYGKVKLVLKNQKHFLESSDPDVLQKLLQDEIISPCRALDAAVVAKKTGSAAGVVIPGTLDAAGVRQAHLPRNGQRKLVNKWTEAEPPENEAGTLKAVTLEEDEDEENETFDFEIRDDSIETVQQRCRALEYPILEEYDFRSDTALPDLNINLRHDVQIRPYQEKSLSKMFGNGRAKSGIIVLPCGAGKTLVGITAACTIAKGVVVLCTSAVSAGQWRNEFLKWSDISSESITTFTSGHKTPFVGDAGVVITTYSMVANNRRRAHDSQKMMEFLQGREWGLMLLDEVHVAPAHMFRRVISSIKCHAKLGLTATLLREDDKISDLYFLIGPKLYEADWKELTEQGHIANVQCATLLCPFPPDWFVEYCEDLSNARVKRTLSIMNPYKFQMCQYLIRYHEARGDKIIVFSDDLYPLRMYAKTLGKALIYGETGQDERVNILENFQHGDLINTLFLSKIGDTSLDLPEATVLIQISSHFGSRRQEAQRLGRILRAKRRKDEGFNAFFYSLVSQDTHETVYSYKRQTFLVDQGYAFKIITRLDALEELPGLLFSTERERRELLLRVLLDIQKPEEEEGAEVEERSTTTTTRARVGRTPGLLAGLSGGESMAYLEQDATTSTKKRRRKGDNVEHNKFFVKLERETKRRRRE